MIFSSSDISRLISGDPVIRALARVKIVDTRPPLEAESNIVIYISRYPVVSELEATWNLWIVDISNEPLDIIIAQLRRLLPGFVISENGIVVKATTTELLSNRTEIKPGISQEVKSEQNILGRLQVKFDELKQSIEDRMLLVGPGRAGKDGINGKDGKDGVDGKNGTDGKDLLATDAELDNLKDVFVKNAQKGQFLMFDGASWVARFVPQLIRASGGGGGGGIEEAPSDGNYYVRKDGQWISLVDALASLIDGGEFSP